MNSLAFALLTRGGPPLCSVGVFSAVVISFARAGSVFEDLAMFCKAMIWRLVAGDLDHHPRQSVPALVHAARG